MRFALLAALIALPGCGGVVVIPVPATPASIACIPTSANLGERIWIAERARYGVVRGFHSDDPTRCRNGRALASIEYDRSPQGGALESSVGKIDPAELLPPKE